MLSSYFRAAMGRANYKILPDDGIYYGEIPGLQGVWASAPTLEECREQLQEVLEDWVLLGLRLGHTLPVIDGIDLNAKEDVA